MLHVGDVLPTEPTELPAELFPGKPVHFAIETHVVAGSNLFLNPTVPIGGGHFNKFIAHSSGPSHDQGMM